MPHGLVICTVLVLYLTVDGCHAIRGDSSGLWHLTFQISWLNYNSFLIKCTDLITYYPTKDLQRSLMVSYCFCPIISVWLYSANANPTRISEETKAVNARFNPYFSLLHCFVFSAKVGIKSCRISICSSFFPIFVTMVVFFFVICGERTQVVLEVCIFSVQMNSDFCVWIFYYANDRMFEYSFCTLMLLFCIRYQHKTWDQQV